MNMTEACRVLQVSQDIDKAALKQKFRKLALLKHPDRNNGHDAEFKLINEAYQIMKDFVYVKPVKRTPTRNSDRSFKIKIDQMMADVIRAQQRADAEYASAQSWFTFTHSTANQRYDSTG